LLKEEKSEVLHAPSQVSKGMTHLTKSGYVEPQNNYSTRSHHNSEICHTHLGQEGKTVI